MCEYKNDICIICRDVTSHGLEVCDGEKEDEYFCLKTNTGPGIGSGKWLILHRTKFTYVVCKDYEPRVSAGDWSRRTS